jgi:hypothetical protein
VWRFVEYCIAHESDARDEILTFLFQLSYCRVGAAYPTAALSPAQRTLLRKFADLGLIYVPPPAGAGAGQSSCVRFYPTAVAVNLIFGTAMHHHHRGPQQQQQPQQNQQQQAAGAGAAGGARAGGRGGGAVRLVDPNQLAVVVETNYQVIGVGVGRALLPLLPSLLPSFLPPY